ncbi:hypothetical protein FD754_024793, partial [Muntiacus muntjak]
IANRWGSITADGDCSHKIKRRLLLERKVMTNLDSMLKSRDITLPTKVRADDLSHSQLPVLFLLILLPCLTLYSKARLSCCSRYLFTFHFCIPVPYALLCHDDELEGRRIAFILYLVPPWDASLGGTLDLFSVDEHFQPKQIVKSLIPSWNTLVFFEVSPVSFHQVSEVLSEEKSRLSISGWFHGPSLTRPPIYFEPLITRSPHIPQDHEILYNWINPTYLDMEYQAQIQEEFEESSEILLKEFLQPEKFAEVCEALERGGVEWSSRGPPNKRFYEKAEESQLPDILRDCMVLFRSEAMFLLLSNFTGLKLHFLAPSEEDEPEDKKERDAVSSAENTEEGTGHSSSEPEDSRAATSDSRLQSDGLTDPEPEEDEGKKAEDIKKRWQEYTEELYKKDLYDPDNHDGVITHLESDILECECTQYASKFGKLSNGHRTGKGQFSFQSQRKAMPKNA